MCMHGIRHAERLYKVVATSRQPVGMTAMAFLPIAFKAILTASAIPQPGHKVWPGASSSSIGIPATL